MIQPPTIGPTVGASTASAPPSVVAMSWRWTGNSRNTAENTVGISMPPLKPCSTRQAISTLSDPLAAQPTDARDEDRQRDHEQPAHAEHAGQQSGQRNGDDLGDQVRGLDPAHLVGADIERGADVGQRGRDHLDVEDRHEHAEAHGAEAEPDPDRNRLSAKLRARVGTFHLVAVHDQLAFASEGARSQSIPRPVPVNPFTAAAWPSWFRQARCGNEKRSGIPSSGRDGARPQASYAGLNRT